MQNVLPRSGARAYTVSDDASADQRYNNEVGGEYTSSWMMTEYSENSGKTEDNVE